MVDWARFAQQTAMPALSLREAFEVVYGIQDIADAAPYIGKAFAIAFGGVVATLMLVHGIDWLIFYVVGYVRYMRAGKTGVYRTIPHRSCGSALYQLVSLFLLFGGVTVSVWFAAGFVGYNFWTSALASVGMGVLATYVFSGPLSMLGAGLALHSTNALVLGEHWEFAGMGPEWSGTIFHMNSMTVTLVYLNPDTGEAEMNAIPIANFLQMPRKRVVSKEDRMREQLPFATYEEWLQRTGGTRKKVEPDPTGAASGALIGGSTQRLTAAAAVAARTKMADAPAQRFN